MNPNTLAQKDFKEEAFFNHISDALLGDRAAEYRASVRRGRAHHRPLRNKLLVALVAAAVVAGLLVLNWNRLFCPEPAGNAVSLLAVASEFNKPLSLGVLDPERSETSEQRQYLDGLKAAARKNYEAAHYAVAVPQFEKLIALDPQQRAAYLLYLAHAKAQLGELSAAREQFQEALTISEADKSWDIAYLSRFYLGLIQLLDNDTRAGRATLLPLQEQEGFLQEPVNQLLKLVE